ncbi:hypothetical protein F2Q70_00031993 [Brassica cretica]|uniref:Uncharacterized protein n=1 Tax=Brassica cretica TaxID=69181 RepID=A0A8S9FHQ0_BRACR|nr:hypothetical protein F2Q70_00031993 [Brassica cretica]
MTPPLIHARFYRRDDPQQLKKRSQSFRQRLLLWTLSSTPIIRQKLNPGLQRHEMSLLRLFETVSNDCVTLALIQVKTFDPCSSLFL